MGISTEACIEAIGSKDGLLINRVFVPESLPGQGLVAPLLKVMEVWLEAENLIITPKAFFALDYMCLHDGFIKTSGK